MKIAFFLLCMTLHIISYSQQATRSKVFPGSLESASFIYHPQSAAMLLIGSPVIPDSLKSDVWRWDGKNWVQINASGPGSRDFFRGALNTRSRQLYFFGGIKTGGKRQRDMWSFNGKKWFKETIDAAGTRDHHNMVYMDHLDAFLIYGGNNNGYPNFDSVTWLLKNGHFTKLDLPGPGFRWHYGMVYDKYRKKVVLYGGGERPDEHWEFDGTAWSKIITRENPGRKLYHLMTYDENLKTTILHGGWSNQDPSDPANHTPRATWEWNGSTWRKIAEEPIFAQTMGYDANRKAIVAYGRAGTVEDSNIILWELKDRKWAILADYGKWDKVDYIKNWVEQHPDDMQALTKYADILQWQTKQFPEAESAYKKLEKANPQNTSLWTDLVFILSVQGKMEEAEAYLSKIDNAGLVNRYMYVRLAGLLSQERKFKEAIPYYKKALAMESKGGDYYNLACAYALLGENDKAFENLNKAAEFGYNSKQKYESDSDLLSVRTDPAWKKLLEKLK